MCLTITTQDVKQSHLKFKNDKVICYKILRKRKTYIESMVIGARYKAGWKKARGKLEIENLFGSIVLHGGAIHVFRNYKRAKFKLNNYVFNSNYVIVKVVCNKKDFIASGEYHEAAFKKVFISNTEFKKAIR